MEKIYDPHAIEQQLYQFWEQEGYFKASKTLGQPNYCIVIPPPNVTGSLHMGHAFQQTLMDALIRYQRMQGKNTLWQVGTDHAGIATQMVVERQITHEEQRSRHDYGRTAFIEKIWQWKAHSGNTITQQMRRLGNSVDWTRERFTLDERFSNAVRTVFIRLYQEQLIYRGKRLVNWDPQLQTAISDIEVENRPVMGHLWSLRYPLAQGITTPSGQSYLVVATTRPETLLGDTAVAVHPHDERYQTLIGQQVALPLTDRLIPIVADDSVDPTFGSGVVKITPAHDFNDYALGQRHALPMISLFTQQATIREQAEAFDANGKPHAALSTALPKAYQGLDRFEARRKIVHDLKQLHLLEQISDHALTLPHGDRSGCVIEPLLTDQWYLRTASLAHTAIDAVKSGAIQLIPQQYENMYFAWMHDLQDWCLSRQLWWGHRIPAWYDAQGRVYVGKDEASIRAQHQLSDEIVLEQDADVLDTWFSAALWSFSSLGWPDDTKTLKAFHPTNVLVTGFDILFFWVARMIMLTTHLLKDASGKPQMPFKQVYITGLIRDENGQKMSKSKGNVIDPLDMIDGISLTALIEKRTHGLMQPQLAQQIRKITQQQFPHGIAPHGTDALRFTLTALACNGRDIHWDMQRLTGYRNFCNKLWNASRFVLLQTQPQTSLKLTQSLSLSLADRWILSELNQAIQSCRAAFDNYRFDLLANTLYEFTWNAYCDWYLEMAKPLLQCGDPTTQYATRHTLLYVLESLLRLAHPVIPFITETIWLAIKPVADLQGDTLLLQSYPEYNPAQVDAAAIMAIKWTKQLIVAVRNLRAEMGINPSKMVSILLRHTTVEQQGYVEQQRDLINRLAKLETITFLAPADPTPAALTKLIDNAELLIPISGLVDSAAELTRLHKAIETLKGAISRIESQLANDAFVTRAPQAVVTQARNQLTEHQAAKAKLEQQHQRLVEACPPHAELQ